MTNEPRHIKILKYAEKKDKGFKLNDLRKELKLSDESFLVLLNHLI